ncbi:ADPribosylglycohydrolase superfamily protein [Acanthamoeba castellanii str. Neff]|uniref:ADP-ribosylhydrolase ARH3 n=1 Tax=Acanthamoeba castellanii (strain ATCC 30010 / Neff) TaxID=1257118 RepID=L8H0W2_ACACF|nr:ADPribosylglycohydrolase superfamily protein [Acanthamoeba castellanii str. Neff]ELR19104.1 ADPribosylglycohydrolase superfamily protein [Acanthamoeba castellanii str. Neff]
MGDALGAGVEGYTYEMIREMFVKTDGRALSYINATHMGVRKLGMRYGMYTDDTQTALALATSLRGYPPTAQAVLKAIGQDGADYRKTGTIAFPDGSYANGGAMRIAPVGLAFRNASPAELREAVRWAIVSSHVHAQAIDGAYLQALSVAMCTHMSAEQRDSFDPREYLETMRKAAATLPMKKRIKALVLKLDNVLAGKEVHDMVDVFDEIVEDDFQIKAVDAMAVVLWAVARYWRDPADCIIRTVGFGGDTDTTAAMVGAIMGAMHGTSWMPKHWYDNLENGDYGRDYCIRIARGLAALDLHQVKGQGEHAVEWV